MQISGRFMSMRRFWRWATMALLAGMVAALLGACAALSPGERTIKISEARLSELIGRQFPFNRRYLEVFDVTISAPKVTLLPESNRIATRFNYSTGSFLLGAREFAGTLDLSYALRFEPSDNTVRLADVRAEGVQVPGVPPAYQRQANRLGGLLTENLLHDFVVHRLSQDDLKTAAGWGYQPGAFKVVPGALLLQLNPVAR
ncbi:MAG: hypothetical protein U1D29_06220 [Burkholderiales bacterium]|nr:hypothetical protein [Burkholderiales bacterium]